MKVYTLTIVYSDDKEEIEYLTEEIQSDESEVLTGNGIIEMDGYFDEEGLKLITGCYIIGEA